MKKKASTIGKLNLVGIILLILLNTVLVIALFTKNKTVAHLNDEVKMYKMHEKLSSFRSSHYYDIIKWYQKTLQLDLPYQIVLKDENDRKRMLPEIVDEGPILVFKYSELNCSACIDAQAVFFKRFIDKFGAEKLIMIVNKKHSKKLYHFKVRNNLENEIYNTESLDSSLNSLNRPLYFVLDKSLKSKMFFFPDKNIPEDTEGYFALIDKFFK